MKQGRSSDVCLFVCVVFNGTSAQKGYLCQESVKIKLDKKSKDSEQKCKINDKNDRSRKNLLIIYGDKMLFLL